MSPITPQVFGAILKARQTSASASTSVPPAPSAWGGSPSDGFSPAAIIGIVTAIVVLLVLIPLVAALLRRYERKRCVEMLPDSASLRPGTGDSSVREHSLKSIMVTREVQRSSVKIEENLRVPEEAHTHARGWSRTEVRGGDWK